MDVEEELEMLEESFETAKEGFEEVKDDEVSGEAAEKQEKAEELIQEIRGQIEFLHEQVNKSEDF